jgi:hypothetical protein
VSNLLPWHPGRLNDEILSSWMLRIAAGNDVSVRRFCAWLGNDDQIWTLDSMADSNPLINSIAVAVGVEKETVIQCLRPSLYGLFGRPISRTGSAVLKFPGLWRRWEGPSDRHRFSQHCPICLLQSGHHQLSWTIGVYSCCVQHSVSFKQDVLIAESYLELCQGFSDRPLSSQRWHCSFAHTAVDPS